MENVFSPAAGHQPQNRHSSVDFEPPSAEQLKQNSLVLFLCRNQALCALCNILAVVCRSTGECVRPAPGLCGCECVFPGGKEQCVDGMQAVCWVMGC